ncbi:hypothetical protein JHK82_025211 [Glycine max]|nr:hypothetical protein JHK86_025331 [Glycine max]KAG5134023.1 hypothetical protein JHK82_025211 [Glycine max]
MIQEKQSKFLHYSTIMSNQITDPYHHLQLRRNPDDGTFNRMHDVYPRTSPPRTPLFLFLFSP